ncbi:30S ribosomal protein S2 [Patescibacteria group bacterium]|nr:30S ribosomal protein S2 [Patescibacteria group bacterium]
MKTPTIVEMLQAGIHFGHQTSRWHPKMKEYIFTERSDIHVIDLEKVQVQLKEVLPQVKALAAEGKQILFISTKPQAKEIVKAAAIDCGMPYLVERWIGGLLTNFSEIRKLIKNYIDLNRQRDEGELERYTKKEQLDIVKKLEKKEGSLAGLISLDKIPDLLFVPSVQKEKTAVLEANKMDVPIIGVCDTNADQSRAAYVIPGNDDAVKSIELMLNLVSGAIKEGREEWNKNKASMGQQVDGKNKPSNTKTSDEKKEEIKKRLDEKMAKQ